MPITEDFSTQATGSNLRDDANWDRTYNGGAGGQSGEAKISAGDELELTTYGYDGGDATTLWTRVGSFPDIQYAEAEYVNANTSFGVGVRLDSGGDGYIAVYGGGVSRLFRLDAGTLTQIASIFPTTVAGTVVRIEASGSTIRLLEDGVERHSVTDATHASGSPGVWSRGGNGGLIDDFECSDEVLSAAEFDGTVAVALTASGAGGLWYPIKRLDSATSVQNAAHTFAVSAGTNRGLVVVVNNEENTLDTCDSVDFGGQAMLLAVRQDVADNFDGEVSIWYLNDAGITAAVSTTITPTFSGTPDGYTITAMSYENFSQRRGLAAAFRTAGDSDSGDGTQPAISTIDLVESPGDLIVATSFNGSGGQVATWGSDMTEQSEIQETTSGCVSSTADRLSTTDGNVDIECTWDSQNRVAAASVRFIPVDGNEHPYVVSYAGDSNTTGSVLTIPKPDLAQSGDVVLAVISNDFDEVAGGWVPQAGSGSWTGEFLDLDGAGRLASLTILSRELDATDDARTDYTFELAGANDQHSGLVVCIADVETAAGVVDAITASTEYSNDPTPAAVSITPAGDGYMVMAVKWSTGADAVNGDLLQPDGYLDQASWQSPPTANSSNPSQSIAWLTQETAEASPTTDWWAGNTDTNPDSSVLALTLAPVSSAVEFDGTIAVAVTATGAGTIPAGPSVITESFAGLTAGNDLADSPDWVRSSFGSAADPNDGHMETQNDAGNIYLDADEFRYAWDGTTDTALIYTRAEAGIPVDHYAQFTKRTMAALSLGVAVRCSNLGENTGDCYYFSIGGGVARLIKMVGGAHDSTLEEDFPTTSVDSVLKIEIAGNDIECFIDGVSHFTHTDSTSPITGGVPGIIYYKGTDSGSNGDSADDYESTGPPAASPVEFDGTIAVAVTASGAGDPVSEFGGSAAVALTASGAGAVTAVPVEFDSTVAVAATVSGSGVAVAELTGSSDLAVTAAAMGAAAGELSGTVSGAATASGAGLPTAELSGSSGAAVTATGAGRPVAEFSGSSDAALAATASAGSFAEFSSTVALEATATGSGVAVAELTGSSSSALTATGSGQVAGAPVELTGSIAMALTAGGDGTATGELTGSTSALLTANAAARAIADLAGSSSAALTATGSGSSGSTFDATIAIALTVAGDGAPTSEFAGTVGMALTATVAASWLTVPAGTEILDVGLAAEVVEVVLASHVVDVE